MITLANNADLVEKLYNTAFLQGLRCLLRRSSEKEITMLFGNYNL